MHTITYQYTAMITPFVFLSAITAFHRLRCWGNHITSVIIIVLWGVCIMKMIPLSPLANEPYPLAPTLSSRASRQIFLTLSVLPKTASVSAQSDLIPHLSHRVNIYTFPNPFYHVAWGNTFQALQQEDGEDYSPCSPNKLDYAITNSSIQYIILSVQGTIFPLSRTPMYQYKMRQPSCQNYTTRQGDLHHESQTSRINKE